VSREHTQAQARGTKVGTLSEAKNLLIARDRLDTSAGKRGDIGGGGGKSGAHTNHNSGIFAVQGGRGHDDGSQQNSKKRHHSRDQGNNRKFKKRRQHTVVTAAGTVTKVKIARSHRNPLVTRVLVAMTVTQRKPHAILARCSMPSCAPSETDADTITWCLDSGAEVNLCYDRTAFEYLEETEPHTPSMANGSEATVTKMGGVAMLVKNETSGAVEERLLEHMYYAPDMNINILAMDYLQSAAFDVSFPAGARACFAAKRDLCLRFDKVNRLYLLTGKKKAFDRAIVAAVEAVAAAPPAKEDPGDEDGAEREAALMHQRYCHASSGTLVKMAVQKVVKGLTLNKGKMTDYECVPCILAKSKRMSYHTKPRRATVPLEKLCVDLSAMGEAAIDGSTQVLFVVDEATRYRWGFLLVHKNDAKAILSALIKRLNNEFKKRGFAVNTLHSDGGGEFIDYDLADLCAEFGIEQTFTNPYSPEENSIVERANGVMAVKVRALLLMTGLPKMLWGTAYLHAIVTVNVTSSKALKCRTPHQALYDEIPDASFLRTWGCLVFATIQEESRGKKEKLDQRSEPALLVGYSSNTKGYLLLAIPSCKILKHRAENLKFMEPFTLTPEFAEKMLLNAYFYGDHDMPDMSEVTPIKTTVASLATPPPMPALPSPP
jgi:transposase InsO family protein